MTATTLGHYTLHAKLGQGGMGEVFRAFDEKLHRLVAIKVMRPGTQARDASVKRFLREARAASALNHPNIVTIHDIGETPAGEPFIVEEFIDGQTLRSALDGPMPLTRIVDIGVQVAKALEATHRVGIVHRDIKPENIMLRADGYAKVLDFGLARTVDDSAPPTDVTHSIVQTAPGSVMGTRAYMSPEQTRGAEAGTESDIFALGIVLYEMASGRRPFLGANALEVSSSILSHQAVPLTQVSPSLPTMFDGLVQRMLDKAPERRPTATEVVRALQELTASPLAAAAFEAPAPSAPRNTVGRDTSRADLRRAFDQIKSGRGTIVAVTGEPGIGKTSLVDDFLGDLATSGDIPILARGRCSERLAGAEAYLPILEALDSLLRRRSGPSLDRVVREIAPTWYVQVGTASSLTNSSGALEDAPAAASQVRMKRELGALFDALTRIQPVVLFIDDLHWADVSTIDLINYLAGRISELRLMILVSYRPSEMARANHPFVSISNELKARGLFSEVPLGFLEGADVERYIGLQFPGHRFPPQFASLIHARTEGSPLFMADVLRYLRDTGSVAEQDGAWTLTRKLPDLPVDLPESVRAMISRKIAQVDEQDRALLVAASVQGSEFDSATLATATGIDPATVEERLDVLERVHVFVHRGNEMELPDRTITLKYRFVHVLYQNVLYASLQPTRRAALSGKVAQALLDHHRDQTEPLASRLALLFEAARDFSRSAIYFHQSAQHAVSLFAFREALNYADRGLKNLAALPDDERRKQQELGLQMIRGLALRSVKGWAAPELAATFARAGELCRELNDRPELFPALWNLAFFNMIRGDLALVQQQTATLLTQAEAAHEPAFVMAVDHVAGVSLEFRGDFTESSRLLERAREQHQPAQHRRYNAMFGIDPGMVARAMSSRPLWALGFPDRALERSIETIALCRSQRQPVTHVFALIVNQGIHLYRGELTDAIMRGDEIAALCREYEFPQELEWARTFQGAAMAAGASDPGAAMAGIQQMEGCLDRLEQLKSGLVRTTFLALLAEADCRAGRIDEGLKAVAEGFAHAERTLEHGFVGELHRTRGELLRKSGHVPGAIRALEAALAHARERNARGFELRAATAMASLMAGEGRSADARALLQPIYDLFTEGHSTVDLVTARTLLSTL